VTTRICCMQSEPCHLCNAGTFSNVTGRTICQTCKPGRFTLLDGSTGCVPCSPGSYARNAGQKSCTLCSPHSFSNQSGQTVCQQCDSLRYADRIGAQFCSECDKDKYLVFRDRSDVGTFEGCITCPTNADCSSGAPIAQSGFWLDRNTEERYTAFICANREACQSEGRCGSNRLPAAVNPLCAACLRGYQESDGECIPCDETNGGLVFLFLCVLFILVLGLHLLSQSSGGTIGILVYFGQMAVLFIGTEKVGGASYILSLFNVDLVATAGSACTISLTPTGQLLSGMIGPMIALTCWAIMSACSYFLHGFGICPLGCLERMMWSQHRRATIQAIGRRQTQPSEMELAPVHSHSSSAARLSVSVSRTGGHMENNKNRSAQSSSVSTMQIALSTAVHSLKLGSPVYDFDRWCRSLLALYLFTFNGMMSSAFTALNCVEISVRGESRSVVQAYPTVECQGGSYSGVASLAIVTILVYFAVLAWIAFVLCKSYTLHKVNAVANKEHRVYRWVEPSNHRTLAIWRVPI
jgi:Tyrosine-protein kinase ephrin type A/B receptor-like